MRLPTLFLICAVAISSAGCAGYHLGPVNHVVAGGQSIQIVPFNNQTLQPRLGDAVTQALREQLQTDGTYRVVTREAGDVVVTGVITDYHREGVSYLRSDVTTTESFRVDVTAHVTAREHATGKILFEKNNVKGYTLVQVGTDLADAERQSAPLLAEDLARNIAALLTEGSW